MKKSLLLFSGLLAFVGLSAQVTLSTEVVTVHTGPTADGVDLTGYTTYRVYANFTNPNDFLSAWGGELADPCHLVCEGSVYQSPLGGALGTNQNPAIFPFVQSAAFDSYLTIGLEAAAGANQFLQAVNDVTQPFLSTFEAQGSFQINTITGGGLFTIFPSTNGYAGAGLKVLIMQLTTNGAFHLTGTVSYFPGGVQSNVTAVNNISTSSNSADIFGCTDSAATNYNPAATILDFSCVFPCALAVTYTVVHPCSGQNNGSVVANITGAQYGALMSWQGGSFQYIYNKTNLSAGTYTVNIIDNVGCTLSSSVTLAALTTGTASVVTTGCNGQNNAEISGNFNGGNQPVMYGLSMGNYTSSTAGFDNLSPGSYTIFAQDANGCTASSNSVNVANPSAINLSGASANNATCEGVNNGSVSVMANGGTGALSYSIGGASFGSGSFTGLGAGTYVITVTDANGCASSTAELTVGINGGFSITATEISDASCFGSENGSFEVAAGVGATAPILFGLSADELAANMGMFSDLAAGTYTVYAQDNLGCTSTLGDITVGQPEEITVEAASVDASCNGDDNGEVHLTADGGSGSYSFELDGDSNDDGMFGGLSAGSYEFTVTDDSGCSVSVAVEITEPSVLVADATSTNALCNGGSTGTVTVSAEGGNGGYTYSINGGAAGTDNSFANLGAGNYSIVVTDALGCEATASTSVSEPSAISVSGTVTGDSGSGDGSINLTVSGGTSGYTYSWGGPNNFTASTQNISGLAGGSYSVTVTDANGCTVTESFDVTVGVVELTGGVSLNIFPNPSNGLFFLNIDGLSGQNVNWQVTDARGRFVMGKESINNAGNVRELVELTGSSNGMYFLQVNIGGEIANFRMVKH